MEMYFDFNFDLNNADGKNSEFVYAFNEQVNIARDLRVFTGDYKGVEQIVILMREYKDSLIEKFGDKDGVQKYKDIFLEGGLSKEEFAAKSLFNAMRYSIAYGVAGKSVRKSFFGEDDGSDNVTTNLVNNTLCATFPRIPSDFIVEMVKEYKSEKNKQSNCYSTSEYIGRTLGRDEQIKYVKENIDAMYTNNQRFKEVWSRVKKFYSETDPISSVVTSPIAIPVFAIVGTIKVFGGEAGEMKMDDIIGMIEESFGNIKNKIANFKKDVGAFLRLDIGDKIISIRKDAIKADAPKSSKFNL